MGLAHGRVFGMLGAWWLLSKGLKEIDGQTMPKPSLETESGIWEVWSGALIGSELLKMATSGWARARVPWP